MAEALRRMNVQFQIEKIRVAIDTYDSILKKTAEMFGLNPEITRKMEEMRQMGLNALGEIEKENGGKAYD